MRHGKKVNHLSRTSSHRKALLSNLASSLFLHKRISTTVAKAKALQRYVEPLITKSKSDNTHSRRVVFSYLQDKEAVKALFDVVAEKVSTRPGGYTRIIKTGQRLGDAAEMCIIELVDFNALLLKETTTSSAKKRTRRSTKKKTDVQDTVVAEESSEAPVENSTSKSEDAAE